MIYIHSKADSSWELWDIPDLDIAQTGNYNLLTHLGTETEVSPFIKGGEKLIAVLGAGKVTILFNVCKRQTILYCSKHASRGKYFGKNY